MLSRLSRVAVLLAGAVPCAMATGQDEGVRRALLVGINDYLAVEVPDLRGCVNDVESMRSLLCSRYGFEPAHVRMLRDAEATRQGILEALARLAREADPADVVWIHYAGHGSQVDDHDGDEDDERDETLLPHDARTAGIADITDDELDAALSQLSSEHVVVVLDSCHSGTGTRSVALRGRSVPKDERTELYARPSTRKVTRLEGRNHLTMSGALPHQTALDGEVAGGTWHGAFSYALQTAMASSPADASPRTLFRRVGVELRRLGSQWNVPMPEPVLEGAGLDQSLLPAAPRGGAATAVAWVRVTVDADGRLWLADSAAPGVAVGSLWSLFAPGETELDPSARRAVAKVTSIAGGRAALELAGAGARLTDGARATLAAPPAMGAAAGRDSGLAIHLRGKTAEEAAGIEAQLRAHLPGLRCVGEGEPAALVVELGAQECRVFGGDGRHRIAAFPSDGGVPLEPLVRVLRRAERAAALVAFDNPMAQLQLDVSVSAHDARAPEPGARGGFGVVADTAMPAYRVWVEGTPLDRKNCLQLRLRADRDCTVTIVGVDPEGEIFVLFPNDYANADFLPGGRVRGGEPVLIPDSVQPGNRAGFHWPAEEPLGLVTIQVFASTDAETTAMIGEKIAALVAAEGGSAPALLRSLRVELATRGFPVEQERQRPAQPAVPAVTPSAVPTGDWTARSVTVRIQR